MCDLAANYDIAFYLLTFHLRKLDATQEEIHKCDWSENTCELQF